jgi:hypothetical protein
MKSTNETQEQQVKILDGLAMADLQLIFMTRHLKPQAYPA